MQSGAGRDDGETLEGDGSGRHRDAQVVRRDRHRGLGIAPLVRVDEPVEELPFLRVRRRGRPVEAMLREVLLHGGARPLHCAVGRGDARLEECGGLRGRPAEHVTRDQRGALARRQHLERGEERELDRLALDRTDSG